MMTKRHIYWVFSFLIFGSFQSFASNTSGVHGPNVNADDRSMQIRFALSPSDMPTQTDAWAYRLHYQHALNDRFRARVIVQARDRGDFEYDYFRTELLYNFKKQGDGIWSSGIRFDIRTREGDRPEEYALNWTNQWLLNNGLRVRGVVIASRQFGSEQAFSGTEISTRSSMSKLIDNGLRVGLEMFNEYGEVGEFGSFNNQSHQVGPMLGGSIGDIKYEVRYLVGVSNGSRDNNVGLRFDKSF